MSLSSTVTAGAFSDLRVSVTDRCNFRCQYCMPADGLPWLDREEILSFEEIERLVRLLARMGVSDLRLTGASRWCGATSRGSSRCWPAYRGSTTSRSPPTATCSSATPTPWWRPASRVNVSIDSLQRDRFFQLTRRDSLPQVLAGLEAIGRHESVRPIKVNAAELRGFTEEEALPFAEFARSTSYQVRFIEFMPLDGDHAWTSDQVLTGEEIRAIVDRVYPLEERLREPHATARVFGFQDGRGELGFINPVSEPFARTATASA